MDIIWLIPIALAIFGFSTLGIVIIYIRWRQRLHTEGILDIRHDGLNAKPGEPRTIFDVLKLEKEHKKEKEK